jgi:hypothetical protein
MRLSDVAVKKLKPAGKTRKVADGGGSRKFWTRR